VSVINFTVNYDLLASQTDSADVGADSDLVALIGTVVFTPDFADKKAVMAADHNPRPAGLKLQPISGYLDSDGRLKAAPGGAVGVRLPAKDPIMDVDGLIYRVDFNVHTAAGEKVQVDPGFFEAPESDQIVELAEVLQSSLASTAQAQGLVGGFFNGNGDVVFEDGDGNFLESIPIPDGFLLFLDNGDSTWSAGS
jgi:hypothetical protein